MKPVNLNPPQVNITLGGRCLSSFTAASPRIFSVCSVRTSFFSSYVSKNSSTLSTAGFPLVNSCSGVSRPGALCGSHWTLFWTEYSLGLKSTSQESLVSTFISLAFSSVAMATPSFPSSAEPLAIALDAAADAMVDALCDGVDGTLDLGMAHDVVRVLCRPVKGVIAGPPATGMGRPGAPGRRRHALERWRSGGDGSHDGHLHRLRPRAHSGGTGDRPRPAGAAHRDIVRCGTGRLGRGHHGWSGRRVQLADAAHRIGRSIEAAVHAPGDVFVPGAGDEDRSPDRGGGVCRLTPRPRRERWSWGFRRQTPPPEAPGPSLPTRSGFRRRLRT